MRRGYRLGLGAVGWASLLVSALLSILVYEFYVLAVPRFVAVAAAVAAGTSYLAGEPVIAYTLAAVGVALVAIYSGDVGVSVWAFTILAAIIAGSHARWRRGAGRLAGSEHALRVAAFEASALMVLAAGGFAAAAATLALTHYEPSILPYPLSTLLSVASGSVVVRVAGVAVLAMLAYYIVARLAQPIAYAVVASREQLVDSVRRMLAWEAALIKASRTWYHRLLYTALSTAGGVAGSAVVYGLASESIRAVLGLNTLPLPSIALLWAASFLASYLGAVAAVRMIRGPGSYWKPLTAVGAILLTVYIALVVVVGGVPPGEALRLLYAPIAGSHPTTMLDLKLAPRILEFELGLRQSFREVEYIARFIAGLLWG